MNNKVSDKGATSVVPFDLEKRINAKSKDYINGHVIYDIEKVVDTEKDIDAKKYIDIEKDIDMEGKDVIMIGSAGIKAAGFLAEFFKDGLCGLWNETFVNECIDLNEQADVTKAKKIIEKTVEKYGEDILVAYSLGESGTFSGLWELANYMGVGIEIQAYEIPIWQQVVEVAEVFDINPYKADASGSTLVVCNNGASVVKYLSSEGILASVVGCTTSNNSCVVTDGETTRYLEPNRINELKGVSYERRDFKTYRK